MKQVVLRIEDSAFKRFMGMVSLCPQVEVCTGDCNATLRSKVEEQSPCAVDGSADEITRRVSLAIKALQRNKTIRHLYDYTWIMAAIGDGIVEGMGSFGSPQKFIDYLKSIGVERVPSRSTISTWHSRFCGRFPNWEFIDTHNPQEISRRKSVVNQFRNALNKLRDSEN